MSKYRIVPLSESTVKVQIKYCLLFWKNIIKCEIGFDGDPRSLGIMVFDKDSEIENSCYLAYVEMGVIYTGIGRHTEGIIKEVRKYFTYTPNSSTSFSVGR